MKAFTPVSTFSAVYTRWLWAAILVIIHSYAAAQPIIEKQPGDLLGIPLDGEAVLSVQAQGDQLEYQWRLNGVNVNGATGSALRLDRLSLENFGSYTVAVSDSNGSINSEPARLVPLLLPAQAADEFTKGYIIGPDNDLDPFRGMFLIQNRNATREPDEPDHAGQKGGKSIWFTWVAPATGVAKFATRGSGFDTLLAAYTGESVATLQQVTLTSADDDRGGFVTSEIQFNAVQGKGYAIAVDGYDGASGDIVLRWTIDREGTLPELTLEPRNQVVGPGQKVALTVDYEGGSAQWFKHGQPTETLGKTFLVDEVDEFGVGRYHVVVSAPERHAVQTVPANIQINVTDGETDTNAFAGDKLSMAMIHPALKPRIASNHGASARTASRGYTTTQTFSTVGSTKDPGEPNHAGVAGGASEWFVYSPPEGGTLHVNTDGSNYDTVLAVYTSSGYGYESFRLIASNNRSGVNGQDRVRFVTEPDVTYFIAVDGVGGASGTVKLNIHLGNPPQISSQPASRTVGTGTNVTFAVTASGTPAPAYQWYFNDVAIANATSSSFTRIGARTNHAGSYHAVVSNAVQVARSASATLTVLIPPTITAGPTSQTVSPGTTASFTVSAAGSPNLRYQWRREGVELPGATNAALTITNAQMANGGSYSVRVTNSVGSAISSAALLTVQSAPMITVQPQSKTVALNGSVVLLVSTTGSPAPTYQWHKNSRSIAHATNATLQVTNFGAADEGNYFVVASNSMGTVSSAIARLASNSPLRASSVSYGTNGTFDISLIGEADTTYILEASQDLTNWFPVSSNANPSGFVSLTDTNAGRSPSCFYRMLKP